MMHRLKPRRAREAEAENRQLWDLAFTARARADRLTVELREVSTRNETLIAQLEDLATRYATLRAQRG